VIKKLAPVLIVTFVIGYILFSLLGGLIFGSAENNVYEVDVIAPISTKFDNPDPKIFNEDSVNPTELIRTEEGNSNNPFGNDVEQTSDLSDDSADEEVIDNESADEEPS